MINPFIWILEKILGPRVTVEERIAHNKRLAGETDGSPVTRADLDALRDKVISMRAPIMACIPQVGVHSTRPDESRLGGWPGWPEGETLPQGENGKPMIFLAQINFADIPAFQPFPRQGLMQIFVACDDLLGCKFPSQNQDGFVVVYRGETEGLSTIDPFGGGPTPEDFVFQENLHKAGRPLAFEPQTMVPTFSHYEIAKEFDDLWNRDRSADYDALEEYFEGQHGPDMYLGGFPRFTQSDFRTADHMADYDQVIMQFGAPEGMMWGDVGEACFLMRLKDLQDRAFDKTAYSWDCS